MTASNRMYLKAVYQLSLYSGRIGIADISELLQVSKASASAGVKRLSSMGYVTHVPYGDIHISASGEAQAQEIMRADDMIRMQIARMRQAQETGLA